MGLTAVVLSIQYVYKPPLVLEYDVGFCFDVLLLLLFNVADVFDMIYDASML